MLLGSHLAGIAIEQSMLGATHACANPLTANFDTTHGIAIGVMLPHVVRWNGAVVEDRYGDLVSTVPPDLVPPSEGDALSATERLARCLERLRSVGRMPATLPDLGVPPDAVPGLAAMAATQWTGTFNPRPFNKEGAMEVYSCAY